jgi:tRNA U34 5-methylaminomethyl-2-thiouridine-forming methyltransferase MnmC
MDDKVSKDPKVLSRRIVLTEDGSSSIEIPEMAEMYHSRKGAIKESLFVYIDHGLKLVQKKNVNILEVGMGTGLNVLLTYLETINQSLSIHYHTLEPYPLTHQEWNQLNHEQILGLDEGLVQSIHTAQNDSDVDISDQFTLRVTHKKLEACKLDETYDLVYYDAFAPSKQSNPWQIKNLQKVFDALNTGGVLTTYCSQGQFKRDLASVGFKVTNPAGPMGKREITVAYK